MRGVFHYVVSLLVVCAVCVLLTGCSKNPVTVHPNAISVFDSQTYDLLFEAQAAIDEAKAQFSAGNLPAAAHGPINVLVSVYNTARADWLIYRDAAQSGKDPAAATAKLRGDMKDLANALVQVRKYIAGSKSGRLAPVQPTLQPAQPVMALRIWPSGEVVAGGAQ